MALPWPAQLPFEVSFERVDGSRTGGENLLGMPGQSVDSAGGFWKATLVTEITTRGASGRMSGGTYRRSGEDRTLAFRAFTAGISRATSVLVPLSDRWRPRDMNGRMQSRATAAPLWLSELAGFEHEEVSGITVLEAAPLRAMQLHLLHPNMPPIRPGHFFGIGDRLHLVSAAWSLDYERLTLNGGALTYGGEVITYDAEPITYGAEAAFEGQNLQGVRFWPPLREPVLAGAPIIIGRPVCKMRPVSMPSIDMANRMSRPTIEFVEAY